MPRPARGAWRGTGSTARRRARRGCPSSPRRARRRCTRRPRHAGMPRAGARRCGWSAWNGLVGEPGAQGRRHQARPDATRSATHRTGSRSPRSFPGPRRWPGRSAALVEPFARILQRPRQVGGDFDAELTGLPDPPAPHAGGRHGTRMVIGPKTKGPDVAKGDWCWRPYSAAGASGTGGKSPEKMSPTNGSKGSSWTTRRAERPS